MHSGKMYIPPSFSLWFSLSWPQYIELTVGALEWSESLKFVSPRTSHYASNYHYPNRSIAFSGEWERWTGWSQPVVATSKLHKNKAPHCTAEWTYWYSLYSDPDLSIYNKTRAKALRWELVWGGSRGKHACFCISEYIKPPIKTTRDKIKTNQMDLMKTRNK